MELLGADGQWSLMPGSAEPSTGLAWTTPEFDDSTWGTGQEGFGYGRRTETRGVITVLDDMRDNYSAVYLRQSFDIVDPELISDLILKLDYDDAFVAYINGVEVARANIGTPGTPEPFDADDLSRRKPPGGVESFFIDIDSVVEQLQPGGNNVLAIQGINYSRDDTDFVLSQIGLTAFVPIQAGDADQDLDFDQLDLVQVQQAAKYLTGQPATFEEGDWNRDGVFDNLDIVAALQMGRYLQGPYAAEADASLLVKPSEPMQREVDDLSAGLD
jgi:hypothetical protein